MAGRDGADAHRRRRGAAKWAVMLSLALALARARASDVTHTGFLTDLLCWDMVNAIDGANMLTAPEEHTVHCMVDIQECVDSGFGVLELPPGETEYTLKYKLDQTGNRGALTLLRATSKRSNVIVTVAGRADGDVLRDARVMEPASGVIPVSNAGDFRRRPESILVAHVVCMLASWGCLLPWGVALARRTRGVRPIGAWFVLHLRLQTYGWGLQMAGMCLGVLFCERYTAHFARSHAGFGVIVVGLGFVQPLNSIFRPHPEPKTRARLAWEWIHKVTGYMALGFSIVAIVTGIQLISAFSYSDATFNASVAGACVGVVPPLVFLAVGHLPAVQALTAVAFRVLGVRGTLAQPFKVQPHADA
ncbi:hypothetical protein KFE25_001808 [Diacronema lutheri]|uniref:Cytochrome b561 domain-containing protein n=2 Tax=Diacronema lutheri TaxID=2081491 RepID=A0A8J5XHA5_DIALT|nr:hypothetical protein KFE25_001808 [Diacronema lutheri]